mgnify:CR=1 FL=1
MLLDLSMFKTRLFTGAIVSTIFMSSEREVVAVIGDGGYQMTIQELGTRTKLFN